MTLTHSLLKVLLRDRTCMALARTFKSTCICLAYRPITFSCTASLSVAARSMGKRKQEIDLESDGIEEEEEEVKPKKPRAPRAKKATEPCVDEQGYSVEPPSLIWKDFGTEPGAKIAAFDLDGTIVNVKSGRQFPQHAGDWTWFSKKKTLAKLKELADEGYKIVIFTNQGSIKSALMGAAAKKVKDRINLITAKLNEEAGEDIPVQVFIAPSMQPGDPMRKPAAGMWHYMVQHCNGGIQPVLSQCFFVGDADGSPGTHGDGDKGFAEAVGIEFRLPQDMFGPMDGKAAVSGDAARAGLEEAHAGTHPNSELLRQFEELSKQCFEAGNEGDPSQKFKGSAYMKAARSLATFREKITEANLKVVSKLPGVGKGSVERIRNYLKHGNIMGEEEAEAAAEAQKEQVQKFSKAAEAAMKFM